MRLAAEFAPIDPDALAALAAAYAQGMTSIRGRRVQRLVRREFAGAVHVLLAGCDAPAAGRLSCVVVGFSPAGAALCATDGTGPRASVVKWRHGDAQAVEAFYDLLKDSLPQVEERAVPLAELRARHGRLQFTLAGVPAEGQAWAGQVAQALG